MVNWAAVIAILVPNVGGWIGALPMEGQMHNPDGTAWYQVIKKPRWTPPNWLFAPVWIVLYSTMGFASYIIYKETYEYEGAAKIFPLTLYVIQLLLNFTWTTVFFKYHYMGWATIHLIVLHSVVLGCSVSFFQISTLAMLLLIPYHAWLIFATFLTYTIYDLNKKENPDKV